MDSTTDVTTGAAPETTSAPPPPAESSPATASEAFTIPRDPKAYQKWRQTGELPQQAAAKPKPKTAEASATSTGEESAEGDESPEGQKEAPASETGDHKQEQTQPQPPQRKNAADRLNELLGDLKRAGLTPHELKTFKREAQQASATQPQTKAAAPETTAQPSAKTAAAEPPKLEDFKTWDEYRAAERKYNDAIVTERVQAELQQHLVRQQAEARLAEAKTRYGDEAETYIRSTAQAVFSDQSIPPVVKALLNESGVCADVLYTIGSDSKELDAFLELARTNPGQAVRKIVMIERLVQDELAKPPQQASNGDGAPPPAATERDESGKFVSSNPPAKKATPPPPPATEVSGRATAPRDASLAAFERGDFRAFRAEENRRALARRQGK